MHSPLLSELLAAAVEKHGFGIAVSVLEGIGRAHVVHQEHAKHGSFLRLHYEKSLRTCPNWQIAKSSPARSSRLSSTSANTRNGCSTPPSVASSPSTVSREQLLRCRLIKDQSDEVPVKNTLVHYSSDSDASAVAHAMSAPEVMQSCAEDGAQVGTFDIYDERKDCETQTIEVCQTHASSQSETMMPVDSASQTDIVDEDYQSSCSTREERSTTQGINEIKKNSKQDNATQWLADDSIDDPDLHACKGNYIEFLDGVSHFLHAGSSAFVISDKKVFVNRIGDRGEYNGWLHIRALQPHWAVNGNIPYGWLNPAGAKFKISEDSNLELNT